MPNPRAPQTLTLDQVKKQLKLEPAPQELDRQRQQLRDFYADERRQEFDDFSRLTPSNPKDVDLKSFMAGLQPPATAPSFREASQASQPAFGVYPQMKGKRAFNDREASANAPLSAFRGLVSGVGGLGGDVETLGRMLIPGVSERSFLPSSEDFQRVLPGKDLTYSPTGAAAQFVGNLAADAGLYGTVKAGNAAARLAGKGAKSLGRMTAEQIAKGVEGQGALASVLSPVAPQYVVKPKGGNFASGSVEKDLKHLKTRTIAGETPAERISKHEALLKDPSLNQDQLDRVRYQLDQTKGEAAIDKWIDSNLTNYVKKEMATPDDPVRLMIDRRYDEINEQFKKDLDRAERIRQRAAEEVDPRRKANLSREAEAAATDAFAQRDFANKYISNLPDEDLADYRNVPEYLAEKRTKAGFDESGVARSDPANMYEQRADDAIVSYRAGDIQAQPAKLAQAQDADRVLNDTKIAINNAFDKFLVSKNQPEGVVSALKNLPYKDKAAMIGGNFGKDFEDAYTNYMTIRGSMNDKLLKIALESPWITKVDPETPIYSSAIGGLNFGHVVDVLRQDVAAGRITPEQLNKVSMEQAVRRAADFDQEMAIRMRDTAIKQQEGFPVYKDYGDEGYRWIELTKPADLTDLPEGFRAEPYKSEYSEGVKIIGPDGKQAAAGDTLDEALKNMSETRLEDALKYEGDTMGHCVGGYCPDVLEGRSRIYSLRDAKGEPHVTVEVKPNQNPYPVSGEAFARLSPAEKAQYREHVMQWRRRNPDVEELTDENTAQALKEAGVQPQPDSILQIKGKGNAKPKDDYIPFVQDFVRSGQWSEVKDLRNTGLRPTSDAFNETEQAFLRDKGVELKPYIDPEETARYQQMFNPTPDAEPEFAQGGAVRISDNPDTMRMELGDRHFQIGGAVKAAKAGKGFYSAVDRAALGLKRPMGTGKEFMAEIKSTPGIKATELKGRKLADIEAMPKMTKDQFVKELEARPPVKIEEKVLGNPNQKEIDELADKLAYDKAVESARYYAERGDDINELAEENYLFNIKNNMEELREEARLSLIDDGSINHGIGRPSPRHEKFTIPGGENYREILLKMPAAKGEGFPGVAGHFGGEPNILASIRVSDRTGPNGEKILHVEEIQSDWHQKGRKQGYKEAYKSRFGEIDGQQMKVSDFIAQQGDEGIKWIEGKNAINRDLDLPELSGDSLVNVVTENGAPVYIKEARFSDITKMVDSHRRKVDDLEAQERQLFERSQQEKLPDAPFKKDWHELALRRVMQEAAEGGYDRVALTKGAEQADRYDLSKHVDAVIWERDPDGRITFTPEKDGMALTEPKTVSQGELSDHLGKEVAEKILNDQETSGALGGVDLQVGGEGMKSFYDKMLPDYLNKLGKQYGVQVDEIGIRSPDGRSDAAMKLGVTPQAYAAMSPDEKAIFHAKLDDLNAKPVHSLQVTPEMRQDINEKGLPLYQQIGVPVGTGAVGMEALEQPAMDDEAVRFSDNPDTMRMELEDKQFQFGGAVKAGKAGKAAKQAVRVPEKIVLSELPNAPSIIIPSKLGRVKEEVLQSKGQYGARRVERAADEIPNLERMYKEQAFREAFLGDNAKALMTMNPADFQRYAKELQDRSRSDIGPKAAELARQGDIDKRTVPTDEYIQHLQRVQGGFNEMPYLNISKEEQGLPLMPFISGHEGRHRSRAMAESGEPSSLVQLSPNSELRDFPRRSQEEYIEALRKELEMTDNMVLPEGFERPPIKLPDVYAMGGAVEGENDVGAPSPQNSASPAAGYAIGGAAKLGKAAKAAAKPSLVIKSKPGIIVSNLIDEEPDIAKRLGAEARAKRQAAADAEGKRQELARQTAPSVGYRQSTPQKPDPLVGTRFVNEPAFGLNPNDPFDPSKFKGGSGMVIPWDSQSRNVRTTQLSGVDLPNQIFDVTHGGIPYAFDTIHVNKGVAGSSGEEISKRVKTRADTAVKENIASGGTGELLHFPITMGYRAEDYALPYSEFSFDWINYKLMTGELTQKQADELSDMVKNYTPPEAKYKGKKPFAEFKGFTDPEGLNQIYTGEGLKVPSGELRKAIADRIVWQKGSQEKLGFNAEDLMNATTYEPLRGVDKGFIGSTVMRNTPGGMQLSPSAGKYPYDTNFSGEHLGRLEDNINVEALFHRTLNPIKRELMERENLKPYNKESLRNAAIGAIEKRNERISQPIDERFLDDYSDYITELKKPSEYKRGGNVKASNSYKKRASMSPLMKRFKTARQSPLNE